MIGLLLPRTEFFTKERKEIDQSLISKEAYQVQMEYNKTPNWLK
jgi:hypothetical protein